jgi:DNA-binding transcriptional ArsR family regulator
VRRDVTRHRLGPALRETLLPLLPRAKYFPDFLTPPSVTDVGEGIDRVLRTPVARMRRELARLEPAAAARPWIGDLAAGHPHALRRLGAVLTRWFEIALAPQWEAIGTAVAAERSLRATKVLSGGAGQLLDDLGPTMTWRAPVLWISGYPKDRELDLNGRGITLIPSYFLWQTPITLADPDLQPVLVYPALRDAAPDNARDRDLAPLLGHTRLAVLRLTGPGATTSELARRAGIAPATASQHATVLRNAGLIVSRRHGNLMLHSLTDLGARLLPDRPA